MEMLDNLLCYYGKAPVISRELNTIITITASEVDKYLYSVNTIWQSYDVNNNLIAERRCDFVSYEELCKNTPISDFPVTVKICELDSNNQVTGTYKDIFEYDFSDPNGNAEEAGPLVMAVYSKKTSNNTELLTYTNNKLDTVNTNLGTVNSTITTKADTAQGTLNNMYSELQGINADTTDVNTNLSELIEDTNDLTKKVIRNTHKMVNRKNTL